MRNLEADVVSPAARRSIVHGDLALVGAASRPGGAPLGYVPKPS
jgi:hypothetical protein